MKKKTFQASMFNILSSTFALDLNLSTRIAYESFLTYVYKDYRLFLKRPYSKPFFVF